MTGTVYERIREAILMRELAPGELLAETRLAAQFGASRTPVREALHRLESEMLVERAGRSFRVSETSPEEILDIYKVRTALEGAAAREAATRATELDHARLRAAAVAMRAIVDPNERAALNRRFHEALWAAGHSPTLIDLLNRLNVHLIRYPHTTLAREERWQKVLEEHDALVDAIEGGDPDLAQSLAEAHMKGAREVRLQMIAESGTTV